MKGISTIHQKGVAHQNLDESSIQISDNIRASMHFDDIPKIKVKLVDFGLSCDRRNTGSCLNNSSYFMNTRNHAADTETENPMHVAANDALSLPLAKKYDMWCCGKICYMLLHHREPEILEYIDNSLSNDIAWHADLAPVRPLSHNIERLKYYNDIIEKMMLVPVSRRRGANYVLNKMLIHEKY